MGTRVRIRGEVALVEDGAGFRDEVAVEEPLELRGARGEPLTVTMRTPGHDDELALGLLFGEGVIDGPRPVGPTTDLVANVLVVGDPIAEPRLRRFAATASCGVCGAAAVTEVAPAHAPPPRDGPVFPRSLLAALPDRLRQPGFARTGGSHATGLFDGSGDLVLVREDVGRHNAVDKVVGRALLDGMLPLHDHGLVVSGRVSFELVQKAVRAGAPVLVAVGAPTSLAVSLAEEHGLTLCGFARGGRINVYTHGRRVLA